MKRCVFSNWLRPAGLPLAIWPLAFCSSFWTTNGVAASGAVAVWEAESRAPSGSWAQDSSASRFLADGSLLVVTFDSTGVVLTRLDGAATVLSRFTTPIAGTTVNATADAQGVVFVASAIEPGNDGYRVYKIDARTGQQLWKGPVELSSFWQSTPFRMAIDPEGSLFVGGSLPGFEGLLKLDGRTGAILWGPVAAPGDLVTLDDMAVDAEGNVVTFGWQTQPVAFAVALSRLSGADGHVLWGPVTFKREFPAGTQEFALRVAPDPSGDVVVTGASRVGGGEEYFALKYSGAAGALLWGPTYFGGPTVAESGGSIAFDGSGMVSICGLSVSGDRSLGVFHLDGTSGSFLWSAGFATKPVALAVDGSGDISYISETSIGDRSFSTAKFRGRDGQLLWGPLGFGPSGEDARPQSVVIEPMSGDTVVIGTAGSRTAVMRNAASDGSSEWPQPVYLEGAGSGTDYAHSVAMDQSGDVLVAGSGWGNGTPHIRVEKLAGGTGRSAWQRPFVADDEADVYERTPLLAVDASGDVIVSGTIRGPGGNDDFSTFKVQGSDGTLAWGPRHFLRTGRDTVKAMQVDSAGNVLVVGDSQPGVGSDRSDFTSLKYNGVSGAVVWGPVFFNGAAGLSDSVSAARIDSAGDLYVVGVSGISDWPSSDTQAVVLKYSGTSGDLLWGPVLFDHKVVAVAIDLDSDGNLFVTESYLNLGSYSTLTRKLDRLTGSVIWGPVASEAFCPSSFVFLQGLDAAGNLLLAFPNSVPSAGVNVVSIGGGSGSLRWSVRAPIVVPRFALRGADPVTLSVLSSGDLAIAVRAYGYSGEKQTQVLKVNAADGSPLALPWTPTSREDTSAPWDTASAGRDVIVAGEDHGGFRTTRLTWDLGIDRPSDGSLVVRCGELFSLDLAARNGRQPYEWSVSSGSLPPGLTLSPAGQVTGSTSAEGDFSLRVRVTDADGLVAIRDLVFTVVDGAGYVPVIAVPSRFCQGSTVSLSVPGPFSSYVWLPGGETTSSIAVSPVQPVTYGILVAEAGGCLRRGAITVLPRPLSAPPAILVPGVVNAGSSGGKARVVPHAGSTYQWSIAGATILAGQGTSEVTFSTDAAGTVTLQVVEIPAGDACPSSPASAVVLVRDAIATTGFFALTPCRVLDTRWPAGPQGGPALDAGATRLLAVGGTCGVPMDAKAVAANVTAVNPTSAGDLFVWPGDIPMSSPLGPLVSGRTRAIMVIIGLSTDGNATVAFSNQSPSPVNVLLDVSGFFR